MKIAVIGGRYKNNIQLTRIARELGYELVVHEGHVNGTGGEEIRGMIARAALVVIVTGTNSHGAVRLAKGYANDRHVPTLIVTELSGSRLRTLLDAMDRRRELGWPWPTHAIAEERGKKPKSARNLPEDSVQGGAPSIATMNWPATQTGTWN